MAFKRKKQVLASESHGALLKDRLEKWQEGEEPSKLIKQQQTQTWYKKVSAT